MRLYSVTMTVVALAATALFVDRCTQTRCDLAEKTYFDTLHRGGHADRRVADAVYRQTVNSCTVAGYPIDPPPPIVKLK